MGTLLGKNTQNQIVWSARDDVHIDTIESEKGFLWIAGDQLHYLFLDPSGQSQKLPENIIHQEWDHDNRTTRKYDHIKKEFHPHACMSTDDTSDI